MKALDGKRILVVEDEFLVSQFVLDTLCDENAIVIGPASTNPAGLELIQDERVDAAILDVNLRGVRSDAIAHELQRRKIPFVVATGYGEAAAVPGAAVLAKPFTARRLIDALTKLLASVAASAVSDSKSTAT